VGKDVHQGGMIMDCAECQDIIRSATSEIYVRLKDAHRAGMVHEQTMTVVMVLVRKIERQVASKVE
jgi:hypothetical protein